MAAATRWNVHLIAPAWAASRPSDVMGPYTRRGAINEATRRQELGYLVWLAPEDMGRCEWEVTPAGPVPAAVTPPPYTGPVNTSDSLWSVTSTGREWFLDYNESEPF